MEFGFGDPGTVTDIDPPRLFAFPWGGEHLRWEVHPDGEGSLLVLEHTFDDRPGAASFAAGWHTCIAALDLALAGMPGDPGVDHVALHEAYVAEFVLDAETVVDGRVRLQRQLTRPADVVWDVLAEQSPPGAVREGSVLEHEVPGGRLRWELVEGTGHGGAAAAHPHWSGRHPGVHPPPPGAAAGGAHRSSVTPRPSSGAAPSTRTSARPGVRSVTKCASSWRAQRSQCGR